MIKFGEDNEIKNRYSCLIKSEENEDEIKYIVEVKAKEKSDFYEITLGYGDYILHQTRNESFCTWDKYEIREGNTFLIFEKSRLLDSLVYMVDIPIVNSRKKEYKHYGIYCLDHIIDIIAFNEPKIKLIKQ